MTVAEELAKKDIKVFQTELKKYKQAIDADIKTYSAQAQKSTLQNYGTYSRVATDAFLDILNRGGKRMRGSLVMLGYEMMGGQDRQMILQAARATEMIQAYILIIDDIQDRSLIRRGGPTAHAMLADYHRQHGLADDPEHFGVAIALNAALGGAHAAQMILANLPADDENRLKVLSIMNQTMLVTSHGQTNDIMNEVVAETDEASVERVLEWKTAHYSLLNPLHVGMVLAGADCHATDAITPYAIHTGKAFQIIDDIIGTFGTEHDNGKSPTDDIREGKRTLLTTYALTHATDANKNFLTQVLGNRQLKPAEFERAKTVLVDCGALDYTRTRAEHHIATALDSLNKADNLWSVGGAQFLRGLAQSLRVTQL